MTKVTFKGNEVTLSGTERKVGDLGPDFTALNPFLEPVTLHDFDKKVKLISVVPSVDTSVCSKQTREFNEKVSDLKGIEVITVSVDLPFAQSKWRKENNLDNIIALSDHKNLDFGKKYGVVIEELRLLARAVFVLNAENEIVYTEYVPEVTDHPNYEKAIQAAKNAL